MPEKIGKENIVTGGIARRMHGHSPTAKCPCCDLWVDISDLWINESVKCNNCKSIIEFNGAIFKEV